jgi:hypothetical protein
MRSTSRRGASLRRRRSFREAASAWLCLAAALAVLGPGCAFPRRSTPVSSVPALHGEPPDTPGDLWKLTIVSAEIPREQRSGLPWDSRESDADPYVRLSVDGRELWQSKVLEDTVHPTFNAGPPRNLAIDRNARVRIELWDDDGVSSDPIGIYEGRALGEAILDAETILKLEGGATLTVIVSRPEPHAGAGIGLYEVRKDALVILQVLPRSPAARAELEPGDRITAIDGRTIEQLGPKRAESALVLAAQNQSELTVYREGAEPRTLKLDRGYIWLSM